MAGHAAVAVGNPIPKKLIVLVGVGTAMCDQFQ